METEESLRVFVRSLLFTHEEAREVMRDIAVVLWRKFEPEMDANSFRRWAFGVARMEVLTPRLLISSIRNLNSRKASPPFVLTPSLHFTPAMRFLTFLSLAFMAASSALAESPNIIVILVDDQGYYDLGCYGATEVKTPRIDAIAKAGTRFTDYYAAAPICSPSRAGLLTGRYPRRVGNETWVHRADSRTGIHPDELTIAELLKDNGYATACIGKWHLGSEEPFLPGNQGFDYYFGLLHNLDPVETVFFEDKGGVPLMRNDEVVKRPADPAELTKLYTDEAIQFIEQHKDGPFFLYLPHTMLHNPLGVSEEFVGSSDWGEYGDAIQELDHNVGRIFDALEQQGIADHTIVIYASDNGHGPGRTPEQKIRGRKLYLRRRDSRARDSLGARAGIAGWRGIFSTRACDGLVSDARQLRWDQGSRRSRYRWPRYQPSPKRRNQGGAPRRNEAFDQRGNSDAAALESRR